MRPDKLRHIFRKLRLAVFGRICRLPIGLGSLRAMHEGLVSHFAVPNVWHRKKGFWRQAAGTAPLVATISQWPYFGPFLAAWSSQPDNSGRQPESLATHRAGRAYYIYVASQNAKQGILAGNPKGSFGRPISTASDRGHPKQEQATEIVGAIAPLRLTA